MSRKSNIEWTQETWNPVVGCSILSPGCTNCYAMKMAARIEAMNIDLPLSMRQARQYEGTTKKINGNAVWTGKLALAGENVVLAPLKRKKPTTYFVNSMGDLFHEDVPDLWIDRVFAVMALSPQHIFQVLTKRAARMRDYCNRFRNHVTVTSHVEDGYSIARLAIEPGAITKLWPLPNVWLGVSTERQQEADARIPLLLQTPAAVRFISAEPLLGPIDLTEIKLQGIVDPFDAFAGATWCRPPSLNGAKFFSHNIARDDRAKLDWVIVGGESGPGARPMHPDWARSLRNQCSAAGVPFFFKQWGEWTEFYDRDRDDPDWRSIPMLDNQMGRGAARWHNLAGGIGFHGERLVAMRNVGKKAAGRALDGMIHDEMPEQLSDCQRPEGGR